MKRHHIFFTFAILLVSFLTITFLTNKASAATYEDLTYYISSDEVTISDCNIDATAVVIPDTIEGYPVTTIGYEAFYKCSQLTSITIGSNIDYINAYAFEKCDSLSAVHISSVNDWLEISFSNQYANPLMYAKNLYVDGELLEQLTVPGDFKKINAWSFVNCESLTSVVIMDGVEEIDSGAFAGCTRLATITIPASVTDIAVAWSGCTSLESIYTADLKSWLNISCSDHLLRNVEKFYCDNQLVTDVIIPEGYAAISSHAFSGYTGLKSVSFSDAITKIYIHDAAFSGCTSLASITFPESVTDIELGTSVFNECISLTEFLIPNNLQSLSLGSSFSGCPNLKYNIYDNALYLGSTQNPYMALVKNTSEDILSCDVHPNTKVIANNAFYDCAKMTRISLPIGLRTIGDKAFEGCIDLTDVKIPDSVISIGIYAFSGCGFTSVVIPDSVQGGFWGTFLGCANLKSVTIGKNINSIGYGTFQFCPIESITIPNNVTSIGRYAFAMTDLVSITIPNSVTEIGDNAFEYCNDLTSVVIGNGVKTIGAQAFYDCEKLSHINIPYGVASIGEYAFTMTYSLESLTIPKSVTYLANKVFYATGADYIYFEGDAPNFDGEPLDFALIGAAYYPGSNPTWTDEVRTRLGDAVTWIPYNNFVIVGVDAGYDSLEEAINNYDATTQYISLNCDVDVDVVLTKNLRLDLNGHNLSGEINLNGHKIYGVDTTTDNYTTNNTGYFNCIDENGNAVVPAIHFKTDAVTFGSVKRYMSVKSDEGYSFHRFYFGITHATLNPAAGGIGYKAAFAGDKAVKAMVVSYGIQLSLAEDFSDCVSASFDRAEFPQSGQAQSRTLLLRNIVAKDMDQNALAANAAAPVYARTFLELSDGTLIVSAVYATSMEALVGSVSENLGSLNSAQQLIFKNFCDTYADVFKKPEQETL